MFHSNSLESASGAFFASQEPLSGLGYQVPTSLTLPTIWRLFFSLLGPVLKGSSLHALRYCRVGGITSTGANRHQ